MAPASMTNYRSLIKAKFLHLYDVREAGPAYSEARVRFALRHSAVKVLQRRHSKPGRATGRDGLTPFESRILQLLATGMTRNEIARQLDRSPQTISNALTVAKDKLGARSLTEAAVIVVVTYQLAVRKTR